MFDWLIRLINKIRLKRLFFKGRVKKWKQKNTEK